nr:ribonuclease H-like domain-containing protein [Tanacetum cinerariifolium]
VVRDSKFIVEFDEMNCYVLNQDLRAGKILRIGLVILADQVLNVLKPILCFDNKDSDQPYKVNSRNEFKYFLTIVDDFSRVVWSKKEIKVFKSDNGTEYVNQQFTTFCESNAIMHQTSCSSTPQQNEIVDRKRRGCRKGDMANESDFTIYTDFVVVMA